MMRTAVIAGALGIVFAASAARGTTITIYNGKDAIGELQANINSQGSEMGIFSLLATSRALMSDSSGRQFRYFQVITRDDEPLSWRGSFPASGGNAVVDSPVGGWDYELPEGDDTLPFYENDAPCEVDSSNRFFTFSYCEMHSSDALQRGFSVTVDTPVLLIPNHQVLFETYLVYIDPSLRRRSQFVILGGYSWGIRTDSRGSQFGIGPAIIEQSSIDSGRLGELNSILQYSGFAGQYTWAARVDEQFVSAPEPDTSELFIIGGTLVFIGIIRRHRHAARTRHM